jgi:hypothetical protein
MSRDHIGSDFDFAVRTFRRCEEAGIARVVTFDIDSVGENRVKRISCLWDVERVLFCVEKFLAGREEELERSMLYTFMEVNSFVHDVRFMSFSVHDSPERKRVHA